MKVIHLGKRNQSRLLAPWRREALDFGEHENPEALAGAMAGLGLQPAVYHVVSRVVDRRMVLGSEEKEVFVKYMREYEAFCQIRILTYCVMSNHFHILVEIPAPPKDRGRSWSDERFLEHVSRRYKGEALRQIASELAELRGRGDGGAAEAYRDKFFARMWNLAAFMHDLKMRFARWFNRRHGRDGHLWSAKFRSVLVENGLAARIVGAYIDLNPVRAGMAADPADYRWSGYGEAVAGVRRAREGIRLLVFGYGTATGGLEASARRASGKWSRVAAEYRKYLYEDGAESETDARKGRKGIPKAEAAKVLAEGGKMSLAQTLRRRVRHFTEGGAVGGRGFLESVFALGKAEGRFGRKRKTGARKIRGGPAQLHSLRDLKN
jgi:REP element-mobilizing transposase RayT